MIASDSFVLRGNVNLVAHTRGKCFLCLLNFQHAYDMQVGKFSGRQRISLSTNFPSLTCTGKLVDKEILCFPLNSKFPVGKILKVFLGDQSITK